MVLTARGLVVGLDGVTLQAQRRRQTVATGSVVVAAEPVDE